MEAGESELRITAVRTASLAANFEWILVQVRTDEGLIGLGECYWGAGVERLVHHLEGLLLGEDPQNVGWLFSKMVRGTAGQGSTGGATVAAISGIELALWDLKGQALDTPIYNLLGGRFRDRIKLYADCGHGAAATAEAWRERARAAVERGFRAIKFDIDNVDPPRFAEPGHVTAGDSGWLTGQQRPLSAGEVDLIVELVAAVRDEIGGQVDLALDCHWNYNVRDAITLARELAPFRLLWLEDPTPPDNVEALKRVAEASPVPICSGENHYTQQGLREMVTSQAVDIVQPDIPKVGGLLEATKIGHLADLFYMQCAAHNVSSPIATVAAAHACATMRNFSVMEFHSQDVPWWAELVADGDQLMVDGCLKLPVGPGLGLTLDRNVAAAHLSPGATLFDD